MEKLTVGMKQEHSKHTVKQGVEDIKAGISYDSETPTIAKQSFDKTETSLHYNVGPYITSFPNFSRQGTRCRFYNVFKTLLSCRYFESVSTFIFSHKYLERKRRIAILQKKSFKSQVEPLE